MSNTLKLDTEKMEAELATLNDAIETFRSFADKAFTDEIQTLQGMNSDFTSKLQFVLIRIHDDSAKELLEKLESYHDSGKAIVKQFKEKLDKGMAQQMK